MLRNRQHSRKETPWAAKLAAMRDGLDMRVPVLTAMIDSLDLITFLYDPDYRHCLNEVLETLSDDEFDRFERLYSRRLTLN